jgi:hypothetical protein
MNGICKLLYNPPPQYLSKLNNNLHQLLQFTISNVLTYSPETLLQTMHSQQVLVPLSYQEKQQQKMNAGNDAPCLHPLLS